MATSTSTALRLTLVISLALNLFAAGVLAGSFWRHGGHHPHRGHVTRGMDPRALRRALPEQDKRLLDQALPAHRGLIRERLQAVREARKLVAAALRAEPFDPEALDAAFVLVRQREMAVAEEAQQLLIQIAGQASPEGREKMAQQMLKRRWRHGPRPEEQAPPPAETEGQQGR